MTPEPCKHRVPWPLPCQGCHDERNPPGVAAREAEQRRAHLDELTWRDARIRELEERVANQRRELARLNAVLARRAQ